MLCSRKILSDPSVNSYFEDLPPHNVTGEDNLYFFYKEWPSVVCVPYIHAIFSDYCVCFTLSYTYIPMMLLTKHCQVYTYYIYLPFCVLDVSLNLSSPHMISVCFWCYCYDTMILIFSNNILKLCLYTTYL